MMNNNIISHRSRGRGRETRADERARQRSFGWVIRGWIGAKTLLSRGGSICAGSTS